MHAVIVDVRIDGTREDASAHLENTVVPRAKQSPGFVSGVWMRSLDGKRGRGTMVFNTEEEANAVASRVQEGMPAGEPVTYLSAEVYEVTAQA